MPTPSGKVNGKEMIDWLRGAEKIIGKIPGIECGRKWTRVYTTDKTDKTRRAILFVNVDGSLHKPGEWKTPGVKVGSLYDEDRGLRFIRDRFGWMIH